MKAYSSRTLLLLTLASSLFTLAIGSSPAIADEAVDIPTRGDVNQRILWMPREGAKASVILFPGGNGKIFISQRGSINEGGNFLVRSREKFAGHQLNVAVIDAPSDRLEMKKGMMKGFRNSKKHAEDISAVVSFIRKQSPVPVWLVGTSRGTESAANGAIRLGDQINGLVLTASITEPNEKGVAVTEMNLEEIKVSTLIVSHKEDACRITPPTGAEDIKNMLTNAPKVEIKLFSGGDRPTSKPCKAKSAHGFLGIENEVVKYIADFINTNSQ